jgi:hypothetical protein
MYNETAQEMENGPVDMDMYLSIDQYYILYRNAFCGALAASAKNSFGNHYTCASYGHDDGRPAKEMWRMVTQVVNK